MCCLLSVLAMQHTCLPGVLQWNVFTVTLFPPSHCARLHVQKITYKRKKFYIELRPDQVGMSGRILSCAIVCKLRLLVGSHLFA